MKKLWLLLRYYYQWELAIKVSVVLGLLLLVLKVALAGINGKLTLMLGLLSFCFLFIIPYFASSTALRQFISRPPLVMVPDMRFYAGCAHLVLAIAGSVFLFLNFRVFESAPYDVLTLIRIFTALSVMAVLFQLALPSRFFVPLVSFAPIALVILVFHFRDILTALYFNTAFTWFLFAAALAGWWYGLWLLTTRHCFKPASLNTTTAWPEAWATFDGGLLTRLAIGQTRTPQGTLLLGYPDNWGGILLRILYYTVGTPLLTVTLMFVIGFGENNRAPVLDSLVHLFLFISLFSAIFCIFMYGELAARARLLWLRFGATRLEQWQLVDYFCRRFLAMYIGCAVVVAVVARLLAPLPGVVIMHYLLIIASYGCFNLYFALVAKIYRLSSVVLAIVLIVSMAFIGIGLFYATNDNFTTYRPLLVFELLVGILGLACRQDAKNRFIDIDWRLVNVRRLPGKLAFSGSS